MYENLPDQPYNGVRSPPNHFFHITDLALHDLLQLERTDKAIAVPDILHLAIFPLNPQIWCRFNSVIIHCDGFLEL